MTDEPEITLQVKDFKGKRFRTDDVQMTKPGRTMQEGELAEYRAAHYTSSGLF